VYTAEDERRAELAGSLPGYLMDNMIRPLVRARFTPVILATEWQTLDFLSTLDRLLEVEGLRQMVVLAWELAAPSLGRFDWSRVPRGIQLLSRDREVILAGAAAGQVVVHIGEGAEALRMALMGDRSLPSTAPQSIGSPRTSVTGEQRKAAATTRISRRFERG
jgi:hypothetical protein